MKKFEVKTRKVIFSRGPIHLVDCQVRMGDGKVLSRQIIEHPGAVVIIPKSGRDRFLLIRQFRFAARKWLWEFPAGGLEPRESMRKAAGRELIEETEFRARKLKFLFKFYPTPGISGEIMYLYLAENLVPCKGCKDEDEEIEVREFTLKQIGALIRRGQIIDGKTLLAYYYINHTR